MREAWTVELHDHRKVYFKNRKDADVIANEISWIYQNAGGEAQRLSIRAIQCLFGIKLGDHYGWPTKKIAALLKSAAAECRDINDPETDTTLNDIYAQLRENYGIDIREDGMIEVHDTYTDPIYSPGEWRPIERKPEKLGSYMVTLKTGRVCFARYDIHGFVGSIANSIVAWTEMPEPWEFWRDVE